MFESGPNYGHYAGARTHSLDSDFYTKEVYYEEDGYLKCDSFRAQTIPGTNIVRELDPLLEKEEKDAD